MTIHQSSNVPFTRENINMCLCVECYVQTLSQCVKDQMKDITEALKVQPLQAKDIPLVYCATGKATCADLDMRKKCNCPLCSVFEKYSLKAAAPIAYHCRDGKAESNTLSTRLGNLFT